MIDAEVLTILRAWAADVGVRAAALLMLAYTAHAALGRKRALARSALWNACLVGLLALPAAGPVLPPLRLPVPALGAADSLEPPAPRGRASAPEPVVSDAPREPGLAEAVPGRPVEGPRSQRRGGRGFVLETPVRRPTTRGFADETPATRERLAESFDRAALGAYLAVAAVLLARLAGSLAAVGRLVARCAPVRDAAWAEAMRRWQAELGVARRARLLASDALTVPVAVGWLRPAVIVPRRLLASASPGLIDAVLVHELGHVRRGDFFWNVVLRLVRAVYWPHPLAWPLGRVVGSVREQACDDLCVHRLGGASGYRASLLAVAAGLARRPAPAPAPALGLAMARASSLARRLAWIDRTGGAPRCLLGRPARLAVAAAVVALAGAIGAAEPAADPPKAATGEPAPAPVATPQPAPPGSLEVIVRAKDTGKPLERATIRAMVGFDDVLLRTDRDGRARLDVSKRPFWDFVGLDVWADGYVQQRHNFSQDDARYPKVPARLTVDLLPGEEMLGGKVVDEQGKPIPGVTVEIWGYPGEKKDPHELAYHVDATTDAQGQWRCRCFRAMTFAYLYLSHSDYLADGGHHPRMHGRPRATDPPQAGEQPMSKLRDFSDEQVMTRGVALAGTVVDQQGRPVAGAEVGWLDGQSRFHFDLPTTSTDAAGNFRFPHARPGRLVLQVKAKGHAPGLKAVDAKDGTPPVAVALGPPRTIAGRVVDTAGKPIAGARVNVDIWRGRQSLGVTLVTDASGRFRWDDAPADSVVINANRTGYDGILMRRVSPDDGEILLTLRRSVSISGEVLDAATGKRIDKADVEVVAGDTEIRATRGSQPLQVSVLQGYLQATLDVEKTPEFRLRVRAKGYAPFESRTFRAGEGQVKYDVTLSKADRPSGLILKGVVRRPDGTPLEGADVVVTYPMGAIRGNNLVSVEIEDGRLKPGPTDSTKTDAAGRFTLHREPDPVGKSFGVVVVHPGFFAEAGRAAIEAGTTITARPWGRVEGEVRSGTNSVPRAAVRYSGGGYIGHDAPYVSASGKARADAAGRFVLDRIVPGDVRVTRDYWAEPGAIAQSYGALATVGPGETAHVRLGGTGRPVVAKIVPPEGFDPKADYSSFSEFSIQSDRPLTPLPKDVLARLRAGHNEALHDWLKPWHASAEGYAYRRSYFMFTDGKFRSDGTIRVEDVPAGAYVLKLKYSANPIHTHAGTPPDGVAHLTRQFVIPEIPGGRSDEPFDLGVLHPEPKQELKVGQPAPEFDVEALGGGRLKLADYRGKYVLLDFWATWCGPCVAELPGLKAVHDRYGKGKSGRLVVVGLSLDAEKDAPRKFVAERGLAWPQGFLGAWAEGGVRESYHVETIPAQFLIGPDGTLKAKGLRGDALADAVARALGTP